MAPSLSVLIATSGTAELLERTLSSLSQAPRPSEYRGTIVVGNGSTAGVREIVEGFADTRYIDCPVANKSLALNRGLEQSSAELIFFTDDDVWVEPDTLVAYANVAAQVRRGQFYGGPVLPDYERDPPDWLKPYLPASARGFFLREGEGPRPEEIDYTRRAPSPTPLTEVDVEPWPVPPTRHRSFLGLNWAAFRQDLHDVGPFDPRFGPGSKVGATGQETTLQHRLIDAGLERIYVPRAVVRHHVPRTRCSAAWTLRRAYRDGLAHGMSGRPGRTPRAVAWRLGAATLGLAWHIIDRRTEPRFRAEFRWNYLRGRLRGRLSRPRKDRPTGW